MSTSISATLAEIGERYRDRRVHYYDVVVSSREGNLCHISGAVLDQDMYVMLAGKLGEQHPGVEFDLSGVQVLMRANRPVLTVATNLTGLYAEPSFLAEMNSQVLAGWQVEVLMALEYWSLVRLSDGYLGWVYSAYLGLLPLEAPTHIVCEPVALLRDAPTGEAPIHTRIMGGTQGVLVGAEGSWIRCAVPGQAVGWLPAEQTRPLAGLPSGEAERRALVARDAMRLIGVPYQWGGCTAMGLDCSGLAQLLHLMIGIHIPRDTDMQYDAADCVAEPFQPGDLLFFDEGESDRPVTHVGVSLGGWRMVHASRARNGVYVDDVLEIPHLRKAFVGAGAFLGRE